MFAQGSIRIAVAPVLAALFLAAPVAAQWSADPTANLAISGVATSIQVPSMAAAPDGGFYASWTGPDLRVQRLDANGHLLWPQDGVRIGDPQHDPASFEGVTRVVADAAGNAWIAYDCCARQPAGSGYVALHKVLPDGSAAWAPQGIAVPGSDGSSRVSAIAATSDDAVVVVWNGASGLLAQKIGSDGIARWRAGGIRINDTYAPADVVATQGGGVALAWMVSARSPVELDYALLAQRFAGSDGAALWNGGSPVPVLGPEAHIGVGEIASLIADGGGVVIAADRVSVSDTYVGAYLPRVQHLDGTGAPLLGANGVAATTANEVGTSRGLSASSFDATKGDIYMVWPESAPKPSSSRNGVFAQRIDAAGQRAWGDAGKALVAPVGGTDFGRSVPEVVALPLAGGFLASWITGEYFVDEHRVTVARIDSDGSYAWPSRTVDIRTGGLAVELTGAISTSGFAAYAWDNSDLKSAPAWISAQDIGFDGVFGVPHAPTDPVFSDGFDG